MRWLSLFAVLATTLSAQVAGPNPSGVSIGHIHLIVNDPDAETKLFVNLLGAEQTAAGSLPILKLPGTFVVVQKAPGRGTPVTEGSDGSTVNHFGFLVKSYADMKAKLAAAGVEVVTDNAANKQITVNFPEKVRVEFTEDASIKTNLTFHHFHLATTDPEALQAWYVKTFGATAGMRNTFQAAKLPGGEVDFIKAPAALAPTKGRTLDHIGFEIKGLEEFCKKLAANGQAFDMAYREMPTLGGLKIAFIIDPVGTRIELTEGLISH